MRLKLKEELLQLNCCKRLNEEGEKEVIKYAKRGNKIYVIKVTE